MISKFLIKGLEVSALLAIYSIERIDNIVFFLYRFLLMESDDLYLDITGNFFFSFLLKFYLCDFINVTSHNCNFRPNLFSSYHSLERSRVMN